MRTTNKKAPPLVQFYEKVREREYLIQRRGLIFSHEEVVHTERIDTTLTLEILCPEEPEVILYNGKKVKMVDIEN